MNYDFEFTGRPNQPRVLSIMILNIFHWVQQAQRILELQSVDNSSLVIEALGDGNSLGGKYSTDKLNKRANGWKQEHHENHCWKMHFRTETARYVEVIDEFRDRSRNK